MQRGFDDVYALMTGATSLFNPQHLIQQDQWVEPEQPGYYITDAITDQAISMINTAVADDKPFFLHLSHVAPHWPLHAYKEDIEKYKDIYLIGWDQLRINRHEKLIRMGLIDSNWDCSERDPHAPEWDSLSSQQQRWEASRMAVYAAMIDRLDQSIGRLVSHLENINELDNTIILFLSDNGGCAEFLREDGWCQWYDHPTWDGRPMRLGNDLSIMPGPDDTFMSYDLPWANASNTPFRLFKHFVHEGGIATPAVVSWANRISSGICHAPCLVEDILPTFMDLAGLGPHFDNHKKANSQTSYRCESFADALFDKPWQRRNPLCFEHEGNAAIRLGKWKAVKRHPDNWELYDMESDRTELVNLATCHTETLNQLIEQYNWWAETAGVRDWPPGDWPAWMSKEEFRTG